MPIQTGAVSLITFPPKASTSLRAGVHLRWSVYPKRGFPPFGFDLFRRDHRPGIPTTLDLAGEAERELAAAERFGVTTWSTEGYPARIGTAQGTQGTVTGFIATGSVVTGQFDPAVGLVRRIELDLVHWETIRVNDPPMPVVLWGVAGDRRVAHGSADLTHANAGQIVTVGVGGDALDGFQLRAGRFAILRVRWTLVLDEADLGWGPPLNPRRIGFPVTTPGYLVPHAFSPDTGNGQRDWQEAAERLRNGQQPGPGGGQPPLAAALAQQFGLPTFLDTRGLFRDALANATIEHASVAVDDPAVQLDAMRLTVLASIDPDFARLAGLSAVDATAVDGVRYDYKVVGYWPGRQSVRWVCFDVPSQPGGSVPAPPGTPGGPVVITVPGSGGAGTTVRAVLSPNVSVPATARLAVVPGLVLRAVDDDVLGGVEVEPAAVVAGPTVAGPTVTGPAVGAPVGGGPGGPTVPKPTESLRFAFETPTDRVRITGRSTGPAPFTVIALAGETVTGVQTAPAGETVVITVATPGTTSVVVTGGGITVTQICRFVIDQTAVEEIWIAFDVTLAPEPALAAPPIAARVMPGFAREGTAEQVVGLTFQPAIAGPPTGLFPLAKLPLDVAMYDLDRRPEGDQPLANPQGGWAALPVDPVTGRRRPLLPAVGRPPAFKAPADWPTAPQDFLDGMIDPDVRYYGYRVRGRDIFGRVSPWSAALSVDAGDRVGPPTPNVRRAQWLERADRLLDAAAVAWLDARAVDMGVFVGWGWPPDRQRQAPDTSGFRVYWNSTPLATLVGAITAVQAVGDAYDVTVTAPGFTAAAPTDAFVGDWVRQGNRQYLVRASGSALPLVLRVSGVGMAAPVPGACSVSLRGPNPGRMDLLGNPLRPDPARQDRWERRVVEVSRASASGAAPQQSAGAAITIQQVQADTPRAGSATLRLTSDWRWTGALPDSCEVVVQGTTYTVLGGSLGQSAALVVAVGAAGPPAPSAATLRDAAGTLRTVTLPAAPVQNVAPAAIVGGTLRIGTTDLAVFAHRAPGALELLVAGPVPAGAATWYPDYELFLTGLALPVDAANPQATGLIGVSAMDGRAYRPDPRTRPGEPTSPGNEGPIASATVRRAYLGAPGASPSPAVAAAEEWAPAPEQFSGLSRYPLRWTPSAGAAGYLVFHATIDAVLDADIADRAARRNAYAGQPALDAAGLAQWRAQQSALGAVPLQALATAQPLAFSVITPDTLSAADPALADPTVPGGLWWRVPLDGNAPTRHFLRLVAVDAAGNRGPLGGTTAPIVVPDVRRPPTPKIRRVIPGDRALWLVWDALDSGATYEIHRAPTSTAPTTAAPDARDMPQLAVVAPANVPEPTSVFTKQGYLPGPAPDSVVAVYAAAVYDPALAPDAQVAAGLPGPFTLAGSTLDGVDLKDGSLIFAVVRYAPGGPAVLAAPATGCAWRDTGLIGGTAYDYRVVAVRQAAIGAAQTVTVRSLPSELGSGVPFDASAPVPPPANAAWDAGASVVRVTWAPAGLAAGLEVSVQRTVDGDDTWQRVSGWQPATVGTIDDGRAASGATYTYRLRARRADGRLSENEPVVGPVIVP